MDIIRVLGDTDRSLNIANNDDYRRIWEDTDRWEKGNNSESNNRNSYDAGRMVKCCKDLTPYIDGI